MEDKLDSTFPCYHIIYYALITRKTKMTLNTINLVASAILETNVKVKKYSYYNHIF